MSAEFFNRCRLRMSVAPRTMSAVFVFALMPVATQVLAQADNNLNDVVRQTLDTNPEIQSLVEAFYAATDDRREVFSGYLPSVDIDASMGRANREFDNRSNFSRNYAEISLTQMLFDGFRVKNRLARFDHASRARYYELLDEAQNKALEVTDAYLGVQRYRHLVTLAQRNVDNHLRTYEHVSERAGSGVGNKADLQQVEGRLALARSNLMTEVANLQSVTARYQRLVGSLPAANLQSAAQVDARLPASLESMLRTGYANSPALYAAFENAKSAESALEETKSNRYPTFELGMRQGIYKNNNGFDNRNDPDAYGSENLVELRARYNLYRGGGDRAAERAAYRRINQAESLRDKACVDLRQTSTIAYADVHNLTQQLHSLDMHRQSSGKVLQAYREQFDIGRRSLLDVLDSENESFQSERAYVNGDYDLTLAKYRTVYGMGQLLQTLAVTSDNIPSLEDTWQGEAAESSSRYCTAMNDGYLDLTGFTQETPSSGRIELSGDALFDVGSAVIREGSRERLQRFASTLKDTQIQSITVIGHTDNTGNEAKNRELSLARAVAVRAFLLEQGVSAQRIDAKGVGSDQPVASNATVEGRSANRRVELQVKNAE